jgi:soluble lytic murein transglycosylase-like protein
MKVLLHIMATIRTRTTATARRAALLLAMLPAALGAAAGEPARNNSFGNVADSAPLYRVFTYRQANGVPVFTDTVPERQPYRVMEFSCYACNPNSRVNWSATRLFTREYAASISAAAREHGIDPALVRAVIHAESGFNPNARSRKGAMGLMQLMPGTARDMGVSNPGAAQQNIEGGVKYLALLLDQYHGDITLATAAYNAGPANVDKYRGVPPFAETQTYVKRVKLLHERYKAQG